MYGRRFFQILSGSLLAVGVAAACSSGSGRSEIGGSGNGTGNGADGGGAMSGTGAGGNVIPPTGSGSTGSGGGGPMLTACDVDMPCPGDEICVAQPMGGGLCSKPGGACMSDTECQNDTFCCSGECRLDGVTDGICVVGDSRPVNDMCKTSIAVGVFAPDLQCEWNKPPAGDPYPGHIQVFATPMVADLPNDSGTAAEIVAVTSNRNNVQDGRIRILNGQTCEHVEVVTAGPAVWPAAPPSVGDLDGDGAMEIVARTMTGVVAYQWDGGKYDVMWEASSSHAAGGPTDGYDGVSIHDLNNDGKAEVIGRSGEVFNGETGAQLTAGGGSILLDSDPVIVDVDADGSAELVANKVFRWNGSGWTEAYPGPNITSTGQAIAFYAAADFGTRVGAGDFDHTTLDGRAEIVAVGAVGGDEQSGTARVYTLEGDAVITVNFAAQASCPTGQATGERGGPPTIGDFDGDGMPEFASAGAFAYRVFDLDCGDPGQDCEDAGNFIRWAKPTQDCTSGQTGSTIFDFEGDGRVEALYADECFVRVYDGLSGDVLFSTYRASTTWFEQPIVADPDNSDRSKIIFPGASNYFTYQWCTQNTTERTSGKGLAYDGRVDDQYAGVRCRDDNDCISQSCVEGYCRCTTDAECGNAFVVDEQGKEYQNGLVCTTPIAGTPGAGDVCRMQHGGEWVSAEIADKYYSGIKVFRDKLDRWASSRNMWNQSAYSITNINDDGTIPATMSWQPNHTAAGLNNFRQNRQGATSADLADITGALDNASACKKTEAGAVIFTGRICNRGLRGVGANMPATFYLGEAAEENIVCQTQTDGPVPVGGCKDISCEIPSGEVPDGSTISMVVNDAGSGSRITDECIYENNTATVQLTACAVLK